MKSEKKIECTGPYGLINHSDKSSHLFNDEDEIDNLLKYKITRIKIFTKNMDGKILILGIEYALRNLYNGKEIVKTRKGSEEFDDFQELKINSGEYLKELIVRFPDNVQYLTQLGFVTNKKNKIVVGNDDSGKLRICEMNSGKNVILGMFGYTCTSVLSCIGCDYTSSQNFASSILFKFFCLRHIIRNNPKFKKNWDKNYEKLPLEYKYIWKVVNLPDNVYSIIMGSCL